MQQFPLSFEFTEEFLHLLLTHSHSSEFGTCVIYLLTMGEEMANHLGIELDKQAGNVLKLFPLSLVSGTFLYDTPQERKRHGHRTHSLWAHLAQSHVAAPLTNPLYDRNSSVLVLSVSHLTVVSSPH